MLQTPHANTGFTTMINKAFLYIDSYPRNASDIPFDLAVDWGDGSPLEEYFRLVVDRVPELYHIYTDLEPKTITVTIRNSCGELSKVIEYVPFAPPECGCPNIYFTDDGNDDWELTISGCITEVHQAGDDLIVAKLITDVSTAEPIVAFPSILEELIGAFNLVSPIIITEQAVDHLYAHLGEDYKLPNDPGNGGNGSGSGSGDGGSGSGDGSGSGGGDTGSGDGSGYGEPGGGEGGSGYGY